MLKRNPSNQSHPNIQGLILIDCWEVHGHHHNADKVFYQNLIQQIAKFDIKQVVAACYTPDQNISAPLAQCFYKSLTPNSFVDILFLKDFVDFCQHQQLINWFVAGKTWQICVHTRNMGLNKFATLTNINFYADHYSFLKENGQPTSQRDFQQDQLLWQTVPEIGYQLVNNHNYY